MNKRKVVKRMSSITKKGKKLFAIFLSMCMLLGILIMPQVANASGVLHVGAENVTAQREVAGSTVESAPAALQISGATVDAPHGTERYVDISITQNPGLAVLGGSVAWDTNILENVRVELVDNPPVGRGGMGGGSLVGGNSTNSPVNFNFINMDGTILNAVAFDTYYLGAFIRVYFTVRNTASVNTAQQPITVTINVAANYDLDIKSAGVTDPTINVLPAPTVVLTPATVNVTDTALAPTTTVSGTATGNITLDTAALPAGVTAAVSQTTGVITVTGVRPATGQPAIVETGVVVPVTRGGITTNLLVDINLTALPAATVVLTPATVNVTDAALAPTTTVSGTATGNITLNTANLPAGVTAAVNQTTGVITVTGVRPAFGQPAIVATDVILPVTRGGITTNLLVDINLTALPQGGTTDGNNNQGGGTTGGGTTGGGATGGGQPQQPSQPQQPNQPQQPTPPTQEPSQPQQPTQQPRPTLQLIFTVGEASFMWHGMNRTAVGAPFLDAATDRLMIPLRTVAEATGANVRWNDATRSAVIYLPTGTLVIPVDQPLPDGMGSTIIVNDRVFVPARFVMEALGATTVEWYEPMQQAIISWY